MDLKTVLQRWEIAYNKENFYRGIRILLELQRSGLRSYNRFRRSVTVTR